MKHIHLKLTEKQFFDLMNVKTKVQYSLKRAVTWEEMMLIVALNSKFNKRL